MRLAILSDTHLPKGRRRAAGRRSGREAGADLALHAGDLSTIAVLRELEAIGPPLRAVHGNVDSAEVRDRLPAQLTVAVAGVEIAMVHDAGPARGRLERLRRRFPRAAAVVFGHSHVPLHEERDGFQIFNPGSPTERRRSPVHTMGIAEIRARSVTFELVTLD